MLLNGHELNDILKDFNLFTEEQMKNTYGITRSFIKEKLEESKEKFNKSQGEDREKAFWDVDQLCMLLVKIAETAADGQYVHYVAPSDEVAWQFGLKESRSKAEASKKWHDVSIRECYQVATSEIISGDTLDKLSKINSKSPMTKRFECCYEGLKIWVTLEYIEHALDKESIDKYDGFYPKCPYVYQSVQRRRSELSKKPRQTPQN